MHPNDVVHKPRAFLRLRDAVGPAVGLNGVVDSGSFEALGTRSWLFRTVGYGHDDLYWRTFVSVLREVGYDDVVSIEHEDLHMSPSDGLTKAVEFLRPLLPA